MKKLVLGTVVAMGLVVAMAGEGKAVELTLCDMDQAILEAEAVISKVENSGLSDAKGVSIQHHVKYLRDRVKIAREAVRTGYAKYPEELYATVTEGTRALELISGAAKETAKQTVAPKTVQTVQPQAQAQMVQTRTQASQAKLAVATIETGVLANKVKLANFEVSDEVAEPNGMMGPEEMTEKAEDMLGSRSEVEVAGPEEMAGLDQEMKVPATGEVDTGELEKILMTIGVASAAGMLGLAGICAIIGRR